MALINALGTIALQCPAALQPVTQTGRFYDVQHIATTALTAVLTTLSDSESLRTGLYLADWMHRVANVRAALDELTKHADTQSSELWADMKLLQHAALTIVMRSGVHQSVAVALLQRLRALLPRLRADRTVSCRAIAECMEQLLQCSRCARGVPALCVDEALVCDKCNSDVAAAPAG